MVWQKGSGWRDGRACLSMSWIAITSGTTVMTADLLSLCVCDQFPLPENLSPDVRSFPRDVPESSPRSATPPNSRVPSDKSSPGTECHQRGSERGGSERRGGNGTYIQEGEKIRRRKSKKTPSPESGKKVTQKSGHSSRSNIGSESDVGNNGLGVGDETEKSRRRRKGQSEARESRLFDSLNRNRDFGTFVCSDSRHFQHLFSCLSLPLIRGRETSIEYLLAGASPAGSEGQKRVLRM